MADTYQQAIDKTNLVANAFIPELWSDDLIEAWLENLVLGSDTCVTIKTFGPGTKLVGDTLRFTTLSTLGTADSGAVETQTVSKDIDTLESVKTITINQDKYKGISVERQVDLESNVDLIRSYAMMCMHSVQMAIDTYIGTLFGTFTPTAVGTDNSPLTFSVVKDAIKALDLNNVPPNDRVLVVSPGMRSDLLGMDEFTRQDYRATLGGVRRQRRASDPIGELPDGSLVYMTTNLPAGSSGKKAIYMHKSAIGLGIEFPPQVETYYDFGYRQKKVRVNAIFGASVLRADSGVVVQGTA